MSNYEKPFLVSGRNTIIHKLKKVEILDGLQAGDEIIIEGVQKVRDGALISRVE